MKAMAEKIDMVRKWRKRSGERVRVIAVDIPNKVYPVCYYDYQTTYIETATADGRAYPEDGCKWESDLVPDEDSREAIVP